MKGSPTKQLGFRLPSSVVKKLDAYAEYLAKKVPGVKPTRTMALRVLLEKGLAEVSRTPRQGEPPV